MCFVGDKNSPLPTQKIKKLLTVRKQKVQNALEWLCKHHKGFIKDGISINYTTLNSLPHDDIPTSILENISQSDQVEQTLSESSSYVPTHNVDTNTEIQDNIPVDKSCVIDVNSTLVSEEDMISSLSSQYSPNDIIKVTSSNTPVTHYKNPNFWTLAFPCLFPYGLGGCDDSTMSLKKWCRRFLNLSGDDRFRLHYSFMFVVHSILNVRSVCRETKFRVTRHLSDSLFVTKSDLQETLKEIKSSNRPNPTIHNPNVKKLMSQIKCVGKNIIGSDFSRLSDSRRFL